MNTLTEAEWVKFNQIIHNPQFHLACMSQRFQLKPQQECPGCVTFFNKDEFGFLACGHKCCKNCHFRIKSTCSMCRRTSRRLFEVNPDTIINVQYMKALKLVDQDFVGRFLLALQEQKIQLQSFIWCSGCFTKCRVSNHFLVPCFHFCCEVCAWTEKKDCNVCLLGGIYF